MSAEEVEYRSADDSSSVLDLVIDADWDHVQIGVVWGNIGEAFYATPEQAKDIAARLNAWASSRPAGLG